MLLFIVNAVMWSVRGAAATRGWATNSDFNIARNFLAFSWFLGLPIFNAVIMGLSCDCKCLSFAGAPFLSTQINEASSGG